MPYQQVGGPSRSWSGGATAVSASWQPERPRTGRCGAVLVILGRREPSLGEADVHVGARVAVGQVGPHSVLPCGQALRAPVVLVLAAGPAVGLAHLRGDGR